MNGLTANSSMSGTLKVTPPTGKCEIHIEFSDPRGAKYMIEAAIGSIAGGALGMKLSGHLTHEGDLVGKVKLEIDLAPLKEATVSLAKEGTRKFTDSFNFLRKDRNSDGH